MNKPKGWRRMLLWLLPQSAANRLKQRQEQTALRESEAERLDRIRNPSKYLGKTD